MFYSLQNSKSILGTTFWIYELLSLDSPVAGSSHKGKSRYIIYPVAVGIPAIVITVGAILYMWRKHVVKQGIAIFKLIVC